MLVVCIIQVDTVAISDDQFQIEVAGSARIANATLSFCRELATVARIGELAGQPQACHGPSQRADTETQT